MTMRLPLLLLTLLVLPTAHAMELEIGVGSFASNDKLFDNTRQASFSVMNSAESGIKYGLTLLDSNKNDLGFSQQAAMGNLGYRTPIRGGGYIQPQAGLGFSSSTLGTFRVSRENGWMAQALLRTGYQWRKLDVAVQYGITYSNASFSNTRYDFYSPLNNAQGVNNQVFNPFFVPASTKVGDLANTSLQLNWEF